MLLQVASMISGVGVVFLEVLSIFVSHILHLKHQVERKTQDTTPSKPGTRRKKKHIMSTPM
jgi:Na+-transporting methylmalonyl-CoA/oxaloacetate decarboxylase gamma subunit